MTIFGKFIMKRLVFFFFLGGKGKICFQKNRESKFEAEYEIANKNFAKWRKFATKEIFWLPVNR